MTDTRPRVGVDVDDVLADFISTFTREARDLFGLPVEGTMPVDWNWSNYGLSEAEIAAVWRRIRNINNFHTTLNKEGGVTLLDKWFIQLNRTYFITSRFPTKGEPVELQTFKWLQEKFGLPNPTVLVTPNKGPLGLALELDYFLDDRPHNCEAVKRYNPACRVFLRNHSHNQGYTHKDIKRVKSFDEFAREIAANK